jgi:beta-lactamase class A
MRFAPFARLFGVPRVPQRGFRRPDLRLPLDSRIAMSNRPSTRIALLALLALLVVALPPSLAGQSRTVAADATPVASPGSSDQIRSLLAGCSSIFGVMIIDAGDQVVFEQNAEVPFVSASLYKLVLLAETLERVESGSLSLDQVVPIQADFYLPENGDDSFFSYEAIGFMATIEDLVYSTGAYSSNVGAQALMSLTSPERLERFAIGLGMTETRYWLAADDIKQVYGQFAGQPPSRDFVRSVAFIQEFTGDGVTTVTTPRDMATFFRLLRDDKLVSPLTSWRIKHVLDERVITDRLPALLPDFATVVHKTGNLDGVLHDVGIVETPSGPVIVIAMAQAASDVETTMAIEQRLGLAAYEVGSGKNLPGRDDGLPRRRSLGW